MIYSSIYRYSCLVACSAGQLLAVTQFYCVDSETLFIIMHALSILHNSLFVHHHLSWCLQATNQYICSTRLQFFFPPQCISGIHIKKEILSDRGYRMKYAIQDKAQTNKQKKDLFSSACLCLNTSQIQSGRAVFLLVHTQNKTCLHTYTRE